MSPRLELTKGRIGAQKDKNKMAKNITAQALGGSPKVIEASTVQDAFNQLGLSGNYTASINGETAAMDDFLCDYSFVTFAQAVKGGNL